MNKKDFHDSQSPEDPTSQSWTEALANQGYRDQLVRDILGSEEGDVMNQGQLVDFLASQVLQGIDIGATHPEAFKLLMSDPEAHAAFSELIEEVESMRNPHSEYPAIGEIDLDFLRGEQQTKFLQLNSSSWLLQLRRTVEELQNMHQEPALAYRGNTSKGGADWISVLHEEVPIDQGISVALSLEATGSENPKEIGLSLSVAASSISGSKLPEMAYDLDLEWGTYKQHIETEDVFRLPLPPLPVSAIADNGQVTQGLNLSLTAIAR